MEHELKCWPGYYSDVESGRKPFEIRVNDRNYQPGDTLYLREWNPVMEAYTGNDCRRTVGYVLRDFFGLKNGFVAMALLPPERPGDRHD